jgi:hypothetical protein
MVSPVSSSRKERDIGMPAASRAFSSVMEKGESESCLNMLKSSLQNLVFPDRMGPVMIISLRMGYSPFLANPCPVLAAPIAGKPQGLENNRG